MPLVIFPRGRGDKNRIQDKIRETRPRGVCGKEVETLTFKKTVKWESATILSTQKQQSVERKEEHSIRGQRPGSKDFPLLPGLGHL